MNQSNTEIDMLKNAAGIISLLVIFCGCAIQQTVIPVGKFESKEVCIIENPSVRAGFIEAYRRTLQNKGYSVRQIPATSSITECPITSTYSANWHWDLATYMAYAEIKVYRDGRPAGEAKYDTHRGGGNLGKFINADNKIVELVNQLFPEGQGNPID
jgi:hypothetical protein